MWRLRFLDHLSALTMANYGRAELRLWKVSSSGCMSMVKRVSPGRSLECIRMKQRPSTASPGTPVVNGTGFEEACLTFTVRAWPVRNVRGIFSNGLTTAYAKACGGIDCGVLLWNALVGRIKTEFKYNHRRTPSSSCPWILAYWMWMSYQEEKHVESVQSDFSVQMLQQSVFRNVCKHFARDAGWTMIHQLAFLKLGLTDTIIQPLGIDTIWAHLWKRAM